MNLLASLIGLVVLAEGLIGISLPGSLVSIARGLLTPSSLYALAITNVVCGLVLVLAAAPSRLPRIVRTVGFFSIAVGVLMASVGFTHVMQALDAWLSLGPNNIRIAAALVAGLGVTLVYGGVRFDRTPEYVDEHDLRDAPVAHTIAR